MVVGEARVELKTTSEGYIALVNFNDKLDVPEKEKPLYNLEVMKTSTGFYKLFNAAMYWCDTSQQARYLDDALDSLADQDIPFMFIAIGEFIDEVTTRRFTADDTPNQIKTFEPRITIYDSDLGCYEPLK